MSFTLDAKARNGARAVKIAILYLEQSLDGWIIRTHYEDWRETVIKGLRASVGRVEKASRNRRPALITRTIQTTTMRRPRSMRRRAARFAASCT